ncbi:MAG: SoxR reducing system RseC family protein [Candidatus Neomarinimicrobiota bacterium]
MSPAIIGSGVVKSVQGDTALVEVGSLEACVGCGARRICGFGIRRRAVLRARNGLLASVGQRVGLTEPPGMLTRLALVQYGIPLVGFLLGVLIPYYARLSIPSVANELVYFCCGLSGLLLAGAVSWKWLLRASRLEAYFFQIATIYKEV